MNKFSKIISLALSAAICASSVCSAVLASDIDENVVNAEDAVSIAAKANFSIENYPYSYVKTFDDSKQIKDNIVYNESSKYRNLLSTRTSNPGYSHGPGYKGDALILNFYAGHRNESYGGQEKESSYGNAAQLWFTTMSEPVYSNPTTGGSVSLTLSEATVGVNKVAFWTKTEKNDSYDRQEPDTVSYSISFRNCGASGITVQIPNDGQWHYVVADLATPFGEGFDGINVTSNSTQTFGNTNGGKPVLKLDGKTGIYPIDNQNRFITDIPEAYVLIDGEYVRVKTFNVEYEADPEGAYVNIPDAEGNPVYYRSDNVRYIESRDSNGGIIYVADDNGDLLFDIKSGNYVTMTDPDVNFADRYSISNVESYRVDDLGNQLLDEEGNPIPAVICGNLVKEIWQTQIYIDEMLFYRTTESGKRTTFLPYGEEDVAYYANTELDSVLVDGDVVYDTDVDGENRVITLPRDLDLTDPDSADRIQVITKTPDVVYAGQKDGSVFVPIDVSEKGNMKSGSVGSVALPETIDDNSTAIVTVISALGTMQDYTFDVKWGLPLASIAQDQYRNGVPMDLFKKLTAGLRNIDIVNYSEETKHVQIMLVIRDKATNELQKVVLDSSNGGKDVAPGETVRFQVSVPSGVNSKSNIAYFYCYDSVYEMNKLAPTIVIDPSLYN